MAAAVTPTVRGARPPGPTMPLGGAETAAEALAAGGAAPALTAAQEAEGAAEVAHLVAAAELPLADEPEVYAEVGPAEDEPVDGLTAAALTALDDLHSRTLISKALLPRSSHAALDETHRETAAHLAGIVASARAAGTPTERRSLVAAIEALAAREMPTPQLNVTLPPTQVEVHTPEMRPEFHVAAPPAPNVEVNVEAARAPEVHVAAPPPADVRVEVPPAEVRVEVPPAQVDVHVAAPAPARPMRAVAIRDDETGQIVAVEHEPID